MVPSKQKRLISLVALRSLLRTPDIRDAELRRVFAVWGVMAGILVQGFFAFFNFQLPLLLEDVFDFVSLGFLCGSLYLLVFTEYVRFGFRLAVGTLAVISTYTALMPQHDTAAAVMNFFVVPAVVFYLLGTREGLYWSLSLIVPVAFVTIFPEWLGKPESSQEVITTSLAGLLCLITFGYVNQHFQLGTGAILAKARQELEKATSQMKRLEGLVPICSYCKKVRDDQGYWGHLETFLTRNSSAIISNGVCPTCAAENSGLFETNSFPVPRELHDIFSWRERYDESKRKYVLLSTLFGVIVLLVFAVTDAVTGEPIGAAVQFCIAAVLMVMALLLWRLKSVEPVYAMMLVPVFVLMIHPFFYGAPNPMQLLWWFLFPQMVAVLVSARWGVVWTVALYLFALVVFTSPAWAGLPKVSISLEMQMYFSSSFGFLSFFVLFIEKIRGGYTSRVRENLESLEHTYKNIRTLKGLIPVCSSCKSIRNDEGFWTELDSYLLNHTDIQLSHGICARCLEKELPDVYEDMKDNDEL